MPESSTIYSIDGFFIYPILNKISNCLCNLPLSPNLITLLNIIPSYFILKKLLEKKCNNIFSLLFIRCLLDCFDGSLARICNKTSKLGAKLDKLLDDLFLGALIFIKFPKQYFIPILFISYILSKTIIGDLWHDNSMIKSIIYSYLCYF